MKTAVLTGKREIQIREKQVEEPGDKDVLVKVNGVGLCGSDLHFYTDGRIGSAVIKGERILGHEVCGRIERTGRSVTNLKTGDLVVLDPSRGCQQCEDCRSGRENLCRDGSRRFLGNAYSDGAMQEYVVSPASHTFKINEGCPVERAVLTEPLSVALHAVNQAQVSYGDCAVVLGVGCIGLMVITALKEKGVSRIIAIDLEKERLHMAAEFGAETVICPQETDPIETVLKVTGGDGAELVIETAGSTITQAQTISYVKRGGQIILVGMAPGKPVQMDLDSLIRKEGTLKTVFRFRSEFMQAVRIMNAKEPPLEDMVTVYQGWEQLQQAFEEASSGKKGMIKAVIKL